MRLLAIALFCIALLSRGSCAQGGDPSRNGASSDVKPVDPSQKDAPAVQTRTPLIVSSAKSACSRSSTPEFREVVQGPEGALYLLTDEENGKLLELTPGRTASK